jgi:hypothetical protein
MTASADKGPYLPLRTRVRAAAARNGTPSRNPLKVLVVIALQTRRKALRMLGTVGWGALVAVTLTSCGRGSSTRVIPASTVVQVGKYSITKSQLGQWMTEELGEDFYTVASHQAPGRLVSEPADYRACVAQLRAIGPIPGLGRRQRQPSVSDLRKKCEELHEGIKTQALNYLVSSYWDIGFYALHGIKVGETELQQASRRRLAERYPKDGELQSLLQRERRTLPEEIFLMEMDLLQQRLLARLQREGPKLSAQLLKVPVVIAESASCQPGYVVQHCTGYRALGPGAASSLGPPPAILLQEIARWRPQTSHGFTGVPAL